MVLQNAEKKNFDAFHFKNLSCLIHNFVILREKVSFRLPLQYKWTLDHTYFQIFINISQCIILILLKKILSKAKTMICNGRNRNKIKLNQSKGA